MGNVQMVDTEYVPVRPMYGTLVWSHVRSAHLNLRRRERLWVSIMLSLRILVFWVGTRSSGAIDIRRSEETYRLLLKGSSSPSMKILRICSLTIMQFR
jgi:hypothetical protein